jgi:hypothetical protein
MAHKRKKEVVEEDYDFVPPEFDERRFLENDIKGTKLLLVTVAFAIVCGIIAFALGGISIYLGLVVLIAGMVALRYLYPLARVPKESVETKALLGNAGLFFFIFLVIWVLLLNIPFSDNANPEIRDVSIWMQDSAGTWVEVLPTGYTFSVTQQGATGIANITARVTDNGGLSNVQILVYGGGISGSYVNMTDVDNHMFSLSSTYSVGEYHFQIKAQDKVGHTSESNTYLVVISLA